MLYKCLYEQKKMGHRATDGLGRKTRLLFFFFFYLVPWRWTTNRVGLNNRAIRNPKQYNRQVKIL